MSFITSPIATKIKETLNKRIEAQKYNFKNDAEFLAHHGSTPWLIIYSNVKLNGSHTSAINYALKGATVGLEKGGFNNLYDTGTFRPKPVLNSFTIKDSTDKGELKQASIAFTCWTQTDLDIMAKLYMSIGASCTIQWGQSQSQIDINAIMPKVGSDWSEVKKNIYNFDNLKKRVIQSGGYYDAMVGVVSNFNWSMQSEGSYECTVDFVTKGHSILNKAIKGNPDSTTNSSWENFTNWLESDLYNLIEKTIKDAGPARNQLLKNQFYTYTTQNEQYVREKYYFISIRFLMSLIVNDRGTIYYNQALDETLNWPITSNKEWPFESIFPYNARFQNPNNKKETHYINDVMISAASIISNFNGTAGYEQALDNILTLINNSSINKFALKATIREDNELTIIDENKAILEKNEASNIIGNNITENIFTFPLYKQNSIVREVSVDATLPDASKQVAAYILNRGADVSTEEGKAFGKLLNNVTDDYAEWVKANNEEKKEKIYKSINPANNTTQQELTWLENTIKNWVIETVAQKTITNNYNLSEAQRKATESDGPVSNNTIKEFLQKNIDTNISKLNSLLLASTLSRSNTTINSQKAKEEYNRTYVGMKASVANTVQTYIGLIWRDTERLYFANNFKYSNASTAANNISTSPAASKANIAPLLKINLSLTLDGISGIYYGNLFTVDYLPSNYALSNSNKVFFQVLNVEQSVSETEWLTKIEGVMRVLI